MLTLPVIGVTGAVEDGTTPVWMGAIAPLLGKVPKNLLKAPLLSADVSNFT
jgi:hypothetical protein